jgi:hypothetical protein
MQYLKANDIRLFRFYDTFWAEGTALSTSLIVAIVQGNVSDFGSVTLDTGLACDRIRLRRRNTVTLSDH